MRADAWLADPTAGDKAQRPVRTPRVFGTAVLWTVGVAGELWATTA